MRSEPSLPPCTLLTAACADWPPGLSDLPDAPQQLHLRGSLPRQDIPHIAIVGSRAADAPAMRFVFALAQALAQAGCAVVSGGARGIDIAAHAGALHGDGISIAVLPTGVTRPYPSAHRPVFQRLLARGALLSEWPEGPAQGWRFIQRNRLIAALAHAVVVVQAPARSGALSTASVSRKLQRPLYALTDAPWQPRATGSLGLLRQGARPLVDVGGLLEAVTFWREHGSWPPPATASRGSAPRPKRSHKPARGRELSAASTFPSHFGVVERRILARLGSASASLDDLQAQCGEHPQAVIMALTTLTLAGVVESKGPLYCLRCEHSG
ncbi:MAG: DNA-processing protein DprA [Polyangiales bacterium]